MVNVKIWQYWNLDYSPNEENRSLDDWADELRSLLINATQLRLRADVPVGAYLSGGLDSSVTAAIIRNYTNAPLNTFSVAFNDKDYDESHFQQEMIQELGTDHQTVCCSYEDIGRIFPKVIQHTEKPVLRTAPAPMFLLSKLVRESQFKVVMTGEGADEVFGGYDLFKENKIRRFWSRQPDSKIRPLLLKRLYPYMKNLQAQSPAYLKAFFKIRPEDIDSPFFSHLPRWDLTSKLKTFFSDDVKQQLVNQDPLAEFSSQLPEQFSMAFLLSGTVPGGHQSDARLYSVFPGRPDGDGQFSRRSVPVPGLPGGRVRFPHSRTLQDERSQRKIPAEIRLERPDSRQHSKTSQTTLSCTRGSQLHRHTKADCPL